MFQLTFFVAQTNMSELQGVSAMTVTRDVKLGRGSYGTVIRVFWNGSTYALKILDASEKDCKCEAEAYKRVGKLLPCKKFAILHKPTQHTTSDAVSLTPAAVLLQLYKGDCSNKNCPKDFRFLSELLKEVMRDFERLHKKGWVHNDVKCQNILFGEHGEKPSLADWGLSKRINSRTGIGKFRYGPWAVHTQKGGRVFADSDFRALVVTLMEIVTGKRCFTEYRGVHTISNKHRDLISHFFAEDPDTQTAVLKAVDDAVSLDQNDAEDSSSVRATFGHDVHKKNLEKIIQCLELVNSMHDLTETLSNWVLA